MKIVMLYRTIQFRKSSESCLLPQKLKKKLSLQGSAGEPGVPGSPGMGLPGFKGHKVRNEHEINRFNE